MVLSKMNIGRAFDSYNNSGRFIQTDARPPSRAPAGPTVLVRW